MSRYFVHELDDLNMLSPRRFEVLKFLSQGLTYKEIAIEMSISIHTVKAHAYEMYDRFGASNAAHMIHMAHKAGIL